MKHLLLHILPLSIIASFMLVSCSVDMESPFDLSDASPTSLKLLGRVTDEEGNPLKGIQAAAEFVFVNGQESLRDTLYSDAGGYFNKFYSYLPEVREVGMSLKDIDQEANGGAFEAFRSSFKTVCTERGEGSFGGSFEVVVEVKLPKAKE